MYFNLGKELQQVEDGTRITEKTTAYDGASPDLCLCPALV
jgi:hypothetical protein